MYLTKFVIPLPIPPLNIDLLSTYHVPGTALDTEFPEGEASRDHALLAHHMIFNKDYAIILCLSTAQERAAFLNYPGWLAGWLAGWLVWFG